MARFENADETGIRYPQSIPLTQGQHQEIVFPVPLVDIISEVAVEWHMLQLFL